MCCGIDRPTTLVSFAAGYIMKALVCRKFGPPEELVVEDLPVPEPGPGEVRLRVEAAGVNFPDALIIEDRYQLKPSLPFSPGGEFAGIVDAAGDGVEGWPIGKAALGFIGWGAFAEQVIVRSDQLIPMPEGLPFDIAGAFLTAYGTCWHALCDRGALVRGETVLVLGASGGIGMAAIEIAKAMGARVIAAASSSEKLAACRDRGADATIDYVREDLKQQVKALTNNEGVDIVLDPVGGAHADAAIRSMRWRGRYLVVGFAGGEIPRIPLNLPLLKGCSIVGVFWGDFIRREPAMIQSDLKNLFELLLQGRIRPYLSGRMSLMEAASAIRSVADRKVMGKLVVLPHI
jgi:NADPH:quinone reductase